MLDVWPPSGSERKIKFAGNDSSNSGELAFDSAGFPDQFVLYHWASQCGNACSLDKLSALKNKLVVRSINA